MKHDVHDKSHHSETSQTKQSGSKKMGDIIYLARLVASGKRETVRFLNSPIE